MAQRLVPPSEAGDGMTRGYEVVDQGIAGSVLHLKVDGATVGELPFRSLVDAEEFGRQFVVRDAERYAAMARHPAGKRRLVET